MRLLIATPCAGGMCTTGYLCSIVSVCVELEKAGVDWEIYTLSKESLINRGRNTCAKYAIDGGFDKILFIDSDLIFSYEKVRMLLDSKEAIIGGTYPIKNFPITVNFNPLEHQRDLFGDHRQQDNYLAWVRKYADPMTGEAEVRDVPTGFMLIDISVLAKLSHTVKWYQNFNPELGTKDIFYEFFPTGVVGQELLSEDWYFCHLAREAGFRVMLQTKAICAHIGSMSYGLGSHVIIGQEPLIR